MERRCRCRTEVTRPLQGEAHGEVRYEEKEKEMISWLVRRVIEDGYARQNRGDFRGLAKMFAADGVFEFQGSASAIATTWSATRQ